eukprot:2669799-Pyramimonas_sp.AAC.3
MRGADFGLPFPRGESEGRGRLAGGAGGSLDKWKSERRDQVLVMEVYMAERSLADSFPHKEVTGAPRGGGNPQQNV